MLTVVAEGRQDDPPGAEDLEEFDPAAMPVLSTPGTLGSRDEIEDEIDLIVAAMRVFAFKQADQVLREIAAYGARLTEMEILLHRVESGNRQYMRIRTMQVQVLQAALERQFKIASRLIEAQRQDLELLARS